MTPRNAIIVADVLDGLRQIPDGAVQCCVTSPPYLGLRDYGVAGQIGLEKSPDEYLAKMVAVFAEVRRVLRDDGVLFLNMGDSYAAGTHDAKSFRRDKAECNGRIRKGTDCDPKRGAAAPGQPMARSVAGLKPKDLCGIPWRLAFSLQADGWYLRQDIIWQKPNPMPESVTDRCTKAHEYIFLLSKSARYYYDAEAVAEPSIYAGDVKTNVGGKNGEMGFGGDTREGFVGRQVTVAATRNARSVWTIPTHAFPQAHFATFPPEIPERCIKAGTSERGACPECGKPWGRLVEVVDPNGRLGKGYHDHTDDLAVGQRGVFPADGAPTRRTTGWQPGCQCGRADTVPCLVLDPFGGAGTTGLVAQRLGRGYILIELKPEYAEMARQRIYADAPLLATGEKP